LLNLIFPDGSIVTGSSFTELEASLRASQWRTFESRREFRREMRARAEVWSGERPRKPVVYQSSKSFILSLVHSGMCMLEVDEPATTAR
jgi:hypothetical protein